MTAAGAGGPGQVIQTVTYTGCSAARLHAATERAVGEIGFIVTARDPARMTFGFRPAVPAAGWPYEQMTATVLADGSGARIVLAGAPAGGAMLAMSHWHQGHAIAMMVLDRVKSVLPEIPEPSV